ncbi:MAG: YibE/F family protein [Dehalobacterium sp.]
MKRFFFFLLFLSMSLNDFSAVALESEVDSAGNEAYTEKTVRAIVLEVTKDTAEPEYDDEKVFGHFDKYFVNVRITEGIHRGEELTVEHHIDDQMAYNIIVREKDEVLLFIEEDETGEILSAYIYEIARDKYLYYLVFGFGALLLILGGMKGLKAIVTLVLTVFAVIKVLLPLVLEGYNPLFVSVIICTGISVVTFLIVNGFGRKTFAAIIGTTGGVMVAGLIAFYIGNLARLTGLGNEEAQMLLFIPQETDFNFQGLLFAGIIIGALGAVMDVGMSIASAMHEIEMKKPNIKPGELIKAGMNVGRDVMGTMSNTLILAYTGGSIHLMLLMLAYDIPFRDIINQDMMASEILRALAGSIGLIITIPLTAVVSGLMSKKKRSINDQEPYIVGSEKNQNDGSSAAEEDEEFWGSKKGNFLNR